MPQIAQILETYSSQLFWLLIFFGLVYIVVGKSMFPKIQGTIELRDKKIADDLVAAERARATADQVEEQYQTSMDSTRTSAQKLMQDAKTAATAQSEATVKSADVELSAKLEAAAAKLAVAKTDALSQIEDVAVDAAQQIVSRISGASVSKAKIAKAVKSALNAG